MSAALDELQYIRFTNLHVYNHKLTTFCIFKSSCFTIRIVVLSAGKSKFSAPSPSYRLSILLYEYVFKIMYVASFRKLASIDEWYSAVFMCVSSFCLI